MKSNTIEQSPMNEALIAVSQLSWLCRERAKDNCDHQAIASFEAIADMLESAAMGSKSTLFTLLMTRTRNNPISHSIYQRKLHTIALARIIRSSGVSKESSYRQALELLELEKNFDLKKELANLKKAENGMDEQHEAHVNSILEGATEIAQKKFQIERQPTNSEMASIIATLAQTYWAESVSQERLDQETCNLFKSFESNFSITEIAESIVKPELGK